jgi:hypothetical protein
MQSKQRRKKHMERKKEFNEGRQNERKRRRK